MYKLLEVLLVCAFTSSFLVVVHGDQPVVDVPTFGTIYGETIPFKHDYPQVDKTINVYKGIPFAKNASNYRFMKPESLMVLEGGELNATTYSSICWQLPEVLENDPQSEDCLYLNIWTPNPTVRSLKMLISVRSFKHISRKCLVSMPVRPTPIKPGGTYARFPSSTPPPPLFQEKDLPPISGNGYHWPCWQLPQKNTPLSRAF